MGHGCKQNGGKGKELETYCMIFQILQLIKERMRRRRKRRHVNSFVKVRTDSRMTCKEQVQRISHNKYLKENT